MGVRLTQLLGNRELAFEDNLEKGRIWVYSDGNMYSSFCNGFCWTARACGKAVIEIWGAAGSGAEMCCCGAGLPGNAPGYVKKCICVTPGNYVCGYVGRSCNNADDLCFRGCSESTCVRWTGCAPYPVYEGFYNPCTMDNGWRGNNPWGWGNGCTMGDVQPANDAGKFWRMGANQQTCNGVAYPNYAICCTAGASQGCLCAQGGKGGFSYCIDDKSPYTCHVMNSYCGSPIYTTNFCAMHQSQCGVVCNRCNESTHWGGLSFACAWGGDVNCCGGVSCSRFMGCLPLCPCSFQYHHQTAAGVYATDGGNFTYQTAEDSPSTSWSGAPVRGSMDAVISLSRWPGHGVYSPCWVGARGCGCYNMQGCKQFLPYGVPGATAHPCPGVRDHGGRGGMGMVRIKFIPNEGENSY